MHRLRRHAIVRSGSSALATGGNGSQVRTGTDIRVPDRDLQVRWPRRVAGGPGVCCSLYWRSQAADRIPFAESDFLRVHVISSTRAEHLCVPTGGALFSLGWLVLAICGCNVGEWMEESFPVSVAAESGSGSSDGFVTVYHH
jgi:hypothetical protein